MDLLLLGLVLGVMTAVVVRLRRSTQPLGPAIASLRPGWVDVQGLVQGSGLVRAPISGREGVGWRVLIEQEQGMRGWVTVVDTFEFTDFALADASGAIAVKAAGSPITLEVGERGGRGGPFNPLPAAVQSLIHAQVPVHGVLFHKGFRWREWVLEAGEAVQVRGHVVSLPGEQGVGYRRFDEVLVLIGAGSRPLEIAEARSSARAATFEV